MYNFFKKLLLGGGGGLTNQELSDMTYRRKFSDSLPWHDYLPWAAYGGDTGVFYNTDDTIGFLWKCHPLSFADEKTANSLEGILRLNLPHGTVLQFILHASPDICRIIDEYKSTKVKNDGMSRHTTEMIANYYLDSSAQGCDKLSGMQLRNYELYVAIKMPVASNIKDHELKDIYNSIKDMLHGAYLHPQLMDAPGLLDWSRRLFNDKPSDNNSYWDENNILRKQVILSQTDIQKEFRKLRIGNKIFKCVTPKTFPIEDISQEAWKSETLLKTNKLFGGIWGSENDKDQIKTPFLYALNIIFDDKTKGQLERKCHLIRKQKLVGTFAESIAERQKEFTEASYNLKSGKRYLSVMPIMWLYDTDENRVDDSVSRTKRIWESEGFIMQTDIGILDILFISALPFGLINIGKNVENIDRHFYFTPNEISPFLPVQADFSGVGKPVTIWSGRKSQVVGVDIFSKGFANKNGLVAGGSGKGKSVFMNYIVDEYYTSGTIIRIVEIGNTYRKLSHMRGGREIEFTPYSNICLNPFTNIKPEEFSAEIDPTSAIITQMAYSTGQIPIDTAEVSNTLIKSAVQWAWNEEGNNASPDLVATFLREYPNRSHDFNIGSALAKDNIISTAHSIAFNMRDFIGNGQYSKWFNGKGTLNFSNDEFVRLEVENIVSQTDLFRVVMPQVINDISRDLYLSDRSRKRMQIFEEIKAYMNSTQCIPKVISALYERARKYNGSVWMIVQSLLFLIEFGDLGNSALANSDLKIILESEDHDKVKGESIVDFSPFMMKIIKSLHSQLPNYSEFAIKTTHAFGVGRLVLPLFAYYKYTSEPGEVAEIDALVKSGMSYEESLNAMVDKYHPEEAKKKGNAPQKQNIAA